MNARVSRPVDSPCDCPDYPADVERDCCCVGGTACKEADEARRRAAEATDRAMARRVK